MPDLSTPLAQQALLLMIAAGVPIALMTLTSFAKIAIVLSVLKNAFGAGDVPSAPIVLSLALALSAYVMSPVASATLSAFEQGSLASPAAFWEQGSAPLRDFLAKHAGVKEQKLFVDLAKEQGRVTGPRDLSLLWPSFAISELERALKVGLVVLLPFLVLDLVVASALLALGLSGLSPVAVGLPFKLLLFVAVDGLALLSRALVLSYGA